MDFPELVIIFSCKIILRLLVCLPALLYTGWLQSETLSVTLSELDAVLSQSADQSDAVTADVLQRISSAINDSNISFQAGALLFNDRKIDTQISDGCNRTVIKQIDTQVALRSDTALSLTLDSLYQPITIDADIDAQIIASSEAQQIVGVRLGECRNLATDSFTFDINGDLRLTAAITFELNPMWTDESTLSLFPTVSLSAQLGQFSPVVDVDDTILSGILEKYIVEEIHDEFSESNIDAQLQHLQISASEALDTALDNGRIDIELPASDDDQITALYQYLQPDARFPITLAFIHQHRQLLLASLLFDEPSSVENYFTDALLCEASSAFMVADNAMLPTGLTKKSIADYCGTALDKERLGNAESFAEELETWSNSPGTRFNISALSIEGKQQPLVRRYNYKTVQTHRGTCALEMRVYSNGYDTQSTLPIIAYHGGSWQHRASGIIGIEATATHLTNAGFTVFAPFYRLVGESDGNIACNAASFSDVIDDANDALDWVLARQEQFDTVGLPSVFGQSAGAHLALSLSVNRYEHIRRAALLYAPTDFLDFAEQIKADQYTNPTGVKILEAITGDALDSLDLTRPIVTQNSFPSIITASEHAYPPMFMLHGEKDALLPFRQSVRLCNAISGSLDADLGPAPLTRNLDSYVRTIRCNKNGSQLHLIAEGQHALDLCLSDQLCLSGSPQSAKATGDSLQAMLDWLQADRVAIDDLSGSGTGSISALGIAWLLLLLWIHRYSTKKLSSAVVRMVCIRIQHSS